MRRSGCPRSSARCPPPTCSPSVARPSRVGDGDVCRSGDAVGPEGGWTPDELALASDRVALGDAVLRVETAALVACAEMSRREPLIPTLPKNGVCTLRGQLPLQHSHGGITQSEKRRAEGYERERRLRGCIGIQRACRRTSPDDPQAEALVTPRGRVASLTRSSRRRCWVPTSVASALLVAAARSPGAVLPGAGRAAAARRRRRSAPTRPGAIRWKLAIDIEKLTQLSGRPFEMLTRFLRMIQVQRQDFNGRGAHRSGATTSGRSRRCSTSPSTR